MAETAAQYALVLTTAGSEEQAVTIAKSLVEEGLAACVNVASEVCSVYRWKGKIEEEAERLLVIKTAAHLFHKVREAIRRLHTYEVPEVVMIPIQDVDPDYREWLKEALRG